MSRAWLVSLWLLCAACACAALRSSFWAPLYDRRLLNYRVLAAFPPAAARDARLQYAAHYGYRGEKLIADLGNGKGPGDLPTDVNMYGDVKFYYT